MRTEGHMREPQAPRRHITNRNLLMLLVAAAFLVVPGQAAVADPAGTSHCPAPESGFISWDTSTEPYQVDNAVDLNGNGVVCAKPLGDKTFVLDGVTYQIYNFIDDVLR
jgi:hypothetical protein